MRVFACFLATFIANGLARFGYVVLIPFLILSGQLNEHQSIQLGIAVMVGYIFGSVVLSVLQKYLSLENITKLSFLVIALSFFACYFDNLPFAWAWIWRFLAGIASALLVVLSAPLCLPFVRERSRPLVNGLVFSGIGVGVVFSGFVLPHFAHAIRNAWLFLGAVSLLAFLISCLAFKKRRLVMPEQKSSSFKIPFFFAILLLSVVLNAIGYLPHTLFWVDYLVRSLHFSKESAGASWAFFGFGATIGTIFSASLAQRMGLKNASIVVLVLKSFSCLIVIVSTNLYWLNLSIFLMGLGTTGNMVLTSNMALHIMGQKHFVRASSMIVLSFAIFQALFSLIFTWSLGQVSLNAMFEFCGICLVISFLILLPLPKTLFRS
ncbi:YbfB/YjiJ family MFS transporter [Helicobacter cynogastricus]|uniref:YbfB/YjiJ family MFS transporter n=1 Tax=Helicobacter cynogastricus TaxID=329937 RepID=UPI0018F84582|nr:YbfB/YjiJ family MFS transporter [Helicobacter cynogastricus]